MGSGTCARRVRDERVTAARRYRTPRCAVGEYEPLGFHATWAYPAATAVPAPDLRRDTAAQPRAVACPGALGQVGGPDGPGDIVAGIQRHLSPGPAPLGVPLRPWPRFAELLDHAVKAAAAPHPRWLHSPAWVRSTSFSDSGRGHGPTR